MRSPPIESSGPAPDRARVFASTPRVEPTEANANRVCGPLAGDVRSKIRRRQLGLRARPILGSRYLMMSNEAAAACTALSVAIGVAMSW